MIEKIVIKNISKSIKFNELELGLGLEKFKEYLLTVLKSNENYTIGIDSYLNDGTFSYLDESISLKVKSFLGIPEDSFTLSDYYFVHCKVFDNYFITKTAERYEIPNWAKDCVKNKENYIVLFRGTKLECVFYNITTKRYIHSEKWDFLNFTKNMDKIIFD